MTGTASYSFCQLSPQAQHFQFSLRNSWQAPCFKDLAQMSWWQAQYYGAWRADSVAGSGAGLGEGVRFIHPLIHRFKRLLIHPLIYSCFPSHRSLINASVHSHSVLPKFMSFIRPLLSSLSFIPLVHSSTHAIIHSSNHSFNHSTQPFNRAVVLSCFINLHKQKPSTTLAHVHVLQNTQRLVHARTQGSTGPHRGRPRRHRGLGKSFSGRSAGPHRGRPSRHRGLGKSFSGRSAGQHRGEPSRHRGLANLTR